MPTHTRLLERRRLHGAPLVVHGRTITPIASVWKLDAPIGPVRLTHVRARPAAVEVIEADGVHRMIPIRDPGRALQLAARVVLPIALGVAGLISARRGRPGA